MDVSPDPAFLRKFVKANDTIKRIEQQTKGTLKLKNWIEVFSKLDIQPRSGMQPDDWAAFFEKINLPVRRTTVVLASDQPAPDPVFPVPVVDKDIAVVPSSSVVPSPVLAPEIPAAPVAQPPASVPEKRGRSIKISLDLRGADIFSALKLISQRTGLSIVASSDVKGSVTIYLQDVDALDAFKMILEMNDLAYKREGSVFKVMTAQEYEKSYGRRFYDTTKVEVVKLNYAKASAVEKMIAPLKSKIGQIIPDAGANALILIDTPENIQIMKDVIATSFDRRHQEVIIEAKIIQIMLKDTFKMGINWESVFTQVNSQAYGGSIRANLNALTAAEQGIRLSVGTLAVDNFTVLFDVLQTAGKTNLVSSPRIAAINNHEARILVGTKEAYVTTTVTTPGTGASTTAEAVNFIDVGMKLYVTPSIGDDGFITLKIRPEVSSVERNLVTAQGNTVPIVRTSESETTVMVKDGVTIVIAGLMEQRKETDHGGVPFLSQVPILGLPFRRTIDTTAKTELAVLLTPRIMTGDVSNISTEDKKEFKAQTQY